MRLSLFVALVAACGVDAPAAPDAPPGATLDARAAADAALDRDAPAPTPLLVEDFGAGPAWPAGWSPLGGVASATVTGGRGALVPRISGYSLGRMGHALAPDARDVDVTFVLVMTAPTEQGVGLYVRQSGGYLQATAPRGAGYAVFVEGFRGPAIGLWRERDGVEEELTRVALPALAASATYRVRFRCTGAGPTQLAARLWPADAPEPSAWSIVTTDATPALQQPGGAAVDSWNAATTGTTTAAVYVDDLQVTRL